MDSYPPPTLAWMQLTYGLRGLSTIFPFLSLDLDRPNAFFLFMGHYFWFKTAPPQVFRAGEQPRTEYILPRCGEFQLPVETMFPTSITLSIAFILDYDCGIVFPGLDGPRAIRQGTVVEILRVRDIAPPPIPGRSVPYTRLPLFSLTSVAAWYQEPSFSSPSLISSMLSHSSVVSGRDSSEAGPDAMLRAVTSNPFPFIGIIHIVGYNFKDACHLAIPPPPCNLPR